MKHKDLRSLNFCNSGTHSTVAIAIVSLLSTACMTSKREEELNAQLKTLELRLIDVEKQTQARERSFDAVKNTTEESTRKFLNAKTELDEVRRQLSMTQGAIDELRVKMSRIQEGTGAGGLNTKPLSDETSNPRLTEFEDWQNKTERRLTKIELAEKYSNDQSDAAKQKTPLTVKNKEELAKILADLYEKNQYTKTVRIASSVINNSTSEPMKILAMEFRAEAYFQLKNYGKAALDLMDILDRYPSYERKPRILLLAGDSCVYLKQLRAAKALYTECVRSFPDREECKASKERLSRLGV
jgi:TolA-binding protein